MKKINENFMGSADCEYSLTNDSLCTVTKGSVYAIKPTAIVFAIGKNTKAYADCNLAIAHASHETAEAYASKPGSSAFALVKGSKAIAAAINANAHATCPDSYAILQDKQGIIHPYKIKK